MQQKSHRRANRRTNSEKSSSGENHMKKFAKLFLFLIGFGFLAVALGPLASHPAAASGSAPVTVTNIPLPVRNGLDSGNNPIPLAVKPQGQPYQDGCTFSGTNHCSFASVPVGMRLVIQEFDFNEQSPSGTAISNELLETTLNSADIFHQFAFTNEGQDSVGTTFYATHQPTALYADPGTTPTCQSSGSFTSGSLGNCNISGYLIPAQ
jgi:hypothetical protein